MIYDPRRRAQELRERIIESMTPQEVVEYAKTLESLKTEEEPPQPTISEPQDPA